MISLFCSKRRMRPKKRAATCLCQPPDARVFVLVLVSCCVGVTLAQQPFGIIVGTVTDPTGATLPAATVMVTSTETQVSQSVVTSATGDYSVPYLVNGTYTIHVEYPGFRTAVINQVVVRAAQSVRADIRMQLGELQQVTEVSATAIALQTDSAVVGTTIDSQSVSDLPLNGRTFARHRGAVAVAPSRRVPVR